MTKCTCNYHLGMGPNLNCKVHGEETRKQFGLAEADKQLQVSQSAVKRVVSFEVGKWYKTSDGFNVEFLTPILGDGIYNVFRHNKENDYKPYYTDEFGMTAYGERIITEEN